jgi:Protein kinase domain
VSTPVPPSIPGIELIALLAQGQLSRDQQRRAEELLERSDAAREYLRALTVTQFPQIPNYTIIEQVGKGGFGVVYKAVHHATERIEALKVLFSKTPLLASYFQNEVHSIARLRHPNIATLYDAQLSAPPLYYTMDFVHGERLNDFLKRADLTLGRRIGIVRQVALAIGYAHSQGVVHRDIKPQNILVDPLMEPHIVDFGIARRLGLDEQLGGQASLPEGPVGTLGYIAPEVLSGGTIDGRADIFALGALLFHCITLEPARLARDAKLREQLLRERRVTQVADLSAIIGRCVNVAPDGRYANCTELVDDLDRYLAGKTISARRDPSWRNRAARVLALTLRNHPIPVRVALVVASALFMALLFEMIGVTIQREPATPRQEAVRVIAFDEATLNAVDAGTLCGDIPGIAEASQNPLTRRAVDGCLMGRLAQAGVRARVVALDYYYTPTPARPEMDREFVRGALALREIGVPVVIGATVFDVNGEAKVSEDFRNAVHGIGTLINTTADYP